MASLSASWLVMNKLVDSHLIRMITFGQPRTGNKEYADAHDKMIPYKYRITHHKDPVPHLPVDGLEGYHHHLAEIFYNNDMTQPDYIECDEQEGLACSDGHLDNQAADHTFYFNTDVESWGMANCPQK
ncbi:hypothetical protein WR25_02272 isoform A [Diploscapter pachys]|uniref:Fungal lipase-type domain-containing protein n=1 Tax=Diploscapter pachys TaxID=2018661 RepID=A0A2A2JH35_9BILA|nr:hypothetical protein WR25_02272 isoform A [Diploscapter pachys]